MASSFDLAPCSVGLRFYAIVKLLARGHLQGSLRIGQRPTALWGRPLPRQQLRGLLGLLRFCAPPSVPGCRRSNLMGLSPVRSLSSRRHLLRLTQRAVAACGAVRVPRVSALATTWWLRWRRGATDGTWRLASTRGATRAALLSGRRSCIDTSGFTRAQHPGCQVFPCVHLATGELGGLPLRSLAVAPGRRTVSAAASCLMPLAAHRQRPHLHVGVPALPCPQPLRFAVGYLQPNSGLQLTRTPGRVS